ncbi:MAG TPA: SpoIIE family protein phosphatase [Mycobacteriales bacterium]|jgi:sigma-B regulation protein RsbU (phosphoserine phosphatase)|nr:SpoIIE family protein phosphatase [Mycobacteriales bacterium]
MREDAVSAFVDALLDDDAEQLYEKAPCGYLSMTPDGTIVKVNRTFQTLTGYAGGQLVGRRRFVDLLTGGGRIYHETHYAPMLRMQGSAREIALDLVCADGQRLPVLVNAVLERDEAGAPSVVRAAVFDATDRRAYERELLHAKERAEASEKHATALARTLQQTLIPPVPPHVPGLDVAAAFRPAGTGSQIGGDFYDVFQLAEDDWFAVLGDVCGKGPEAAVITTLLRYAVRAAAVTSPDPAAALRITNDVLRSHDTERFCTALLVRLRRRDGRWTAVVCAAGHPLPLLVPAVGPAQLVGEPGSLLGVLPSLDLPATVLELAHGDRLLLYTDGVTEARRSGQEYGEERLLARAGDTAQGSAAVVSAVLEDVLEFQHGVPRDDIALLAVTPD